MDLTILALAAYRFGVSVGAVFNTGVWRQHRLIRQNYGFSIATVVVFGLGDTASSYERIGTEILHGPAKNAISFRQAVTDECNMTAIGVRLLALRQ